MLVLWIFCTFLGLFYGMVHIILDRSSKLLKTSLPVPFGASDAEMIEFQVNSVDYVTIFAHADDYLDGYTKEQIEEKIGFELPGETYQFKFDTLVNLEKEDYFAPFSSPRHKPKHIHELGRDLEASLRIHREARSAEAYYVFAVSGSLYQFYGQMLKDKAPEYGFRLYEGVGEEGLGYVICW